MKKDDTARTPEEIAAEERRRRRSEAAKKGAATKRAKAEAARKAAEEEKSSSAAAVIDVTETKAEATADTTSTNGDGTSSSSSAIIVLPAGDTGKNDANPSAQYVAPATYSDTTNTSKKEEKGGTMKKVLNILGWVVALILVAILLVVLLSLKGCNGTPVPSATADADARIAELEGKVSNLSSALAVKDAENESLRTQLSAASQQAPVNVNVDNHNDVVVNVGASAAANATQAQSVYGDANASSENKAGVWLSDDEYASLIAASSSEPEIVYQDRVVYRDREVEKTVTVVDEAEVDRLNQELASRDEEIDRLKDQLASRDAEISKLRDQLSEALEEISNLKEQIRNHKCPSCDGSCSYCKDLKKALEQKDRKIQELEAELEGWSHHVCPEAGVEYVYVPEYIYVTVPSTGSGTPEYNSTQPEPVWPGEGDGSTITSPDESGSGSLTGGN